MPCVWSWGLGLWGNLSFGTEQEERSVPCAWCVLPVLRCQGRARGGVGCVTEQTQEPRAHLLLCCMHNYTGAFLKWLSNPPLSQIWLLLIHAWSAEWIWFLQRWDDAFNRANTFPFCLETQSQQQSKQEKSPCFLNDVIYLSAKVLCISSGHRPAHVWLC